MAMITHGMRNVLLVLPVLVAPASAAWAASLSGRVFEDPNYGGGAGRNYTAANASAQASGFVASPAGDFVGVPNARVEVFNTTTGRCVTTATTANDGTWSVTGLSAATHVVRVVNRSVPSVRAGWSAAIPVQTFRSNGDADADNTADPDANRVGGENPALVDAAASADCSGGAGATTLASLSSSTAVPQSIGTFALATAVTDVVGVDFGFNFSTVVATRDAGQGTLRQFVANAAELGNRAQLAQAGCRADWRTNTVSTLPAARETSIFMVSNNSTAVSTCVAAGYTAGGLRAGVNLFTGGRALISVSSNLALGTADVILDATTQTQNVGNDVTGTLGTGGTVGVGATALPLFQRPEVEVDGSGVVFQANAARTEVRGFALHNAGIRLTGNDSLAQDNLVGMRSNGTTATAFTAAAGIQLTTGTGLLARHNYVRVNNSGIRLEVNSVNARVDFNEVDRPTTGHTNTFDGILVIGAATNPTVELNLVLNQRGGGLELGFANGATVTNSVWQENTVRFNGFDTVPTVPSTEPVGFAVWDVSATTTALVRRNIITDNAANGILVMAAQNIRISENVLARNGVVPGVNLSIELDPVSRNPNGYGTPQGVSANDGVLNPAQPNSGLDYPVFTTAVLQGNVLTLEGFVGSDPDQVAFANATVEVFQLLDDGDNNGEIILGDGQSVPHGETIRWLGTVLADASGNINTTLTVSGLSVGDIIGATATLCTTNPCASSTAVGFTSEVGSNRVSANTERGDAPEGGTVVDGVARNYRSSSAGGGPVHGVFNTLRIGALLDSDFDGLPTAAADGDDSDGVDDEDGVAATLPTLSVGATTFALPVTVTHTAGGTARLHGWIDFNVNGAFEATEYTFVSVANGTNNGTATLTWNNLGAGGSNPPAPVAGTSFIRLRLTTSTLTDVAGTPAIDERTVVLASNGEVEDHLIRINDIPRTSPDTLNINEDASGNVAVLSNDSGFRDGVAALTITTQGLLGVATVNTGGTPSVADDTVDYVPNLNANGVDTFVYTVCDPQADCTAGTVTVNIAALNDAPTISNVADRSTNEDTATGAVAVTVADVDNAAGTLVLTASSSNTTLVPNANITLGGAAGARTVTLVPALNQTGNTTITLTVSDGALTATDTFVLTVTAVNDAPTISNVVDRSVNEDTSTGAIAFTVADVDTALTSLTVTGASSNTTLVPNANITLGGTAGARTVTILPALNQTGTAIITLTVSDGALTSTDTFVLTVNAVNDAPTISNVVDQSVNEDTSTGAIAVTLADVDTALGSLVLTAASSNTTLVPNANITLGGSGGARTVTIVPALNQTGNTTITLTVSDGVLSATDTFVLTVTAVNDAPTISNVVDQSVNEDASTGAIAFTVADVDTALTSLTVTGASSNTTLVPNANITLGGTAGARTVTILPALNQTGTTTITLTVSDGALTATDTFVLTVNAVNDAPTISSVGDQTVDEDTSTGPIAFTVADLDTALMSLTVTGSSSNTSLVPTANITVGGSLGARTVTILPAPNQTGTTTITLTVSDGALTATDTFVLTVTAVNDAPAISNVVDETVDEDTSTGAIAFTVADVDTALTSLTVTGVSSNTAVVPNANITLGGTAGARTVTLVPAPNQTGSTTITLTVSDGALTATETFVLNVSAVNDAPTITSNGASATASISVAEPSTAVTTVTATDVDAASTLTFSIGGGADAAAFAVDPITGVLTFVAPPDFEAPTDSDVDNAYVVVVQVSDGTLTDTQTLTVTVTNTNDAPIITSNGGGGAASLSVPENATAVTTVTATDVDSPTLAFALTGDDAALFDVDVNTGVLSFRAAPDFEVPADANTNNVYLVTVRVTDGAGGVDTQDLTITVTNVAEPPAITSAATASVPERTTAVLTVTAVGPEPTDLLTFTIAGGADGAAFTLDVASGALAFTVPPLFATAGDADGDHVYEVLVEVSDGTATTQQLVLVTVTNVNDAPVVTSALTASVTEGQTAALTLTATDEDRDLLTYALAGGPDAARFTINPLTGALTLAPAPDFEAPTDADANNTYAVDVSVNDGNGGVTTVSLVITVTNTGCQASTDCGGATPVCNTGTDTCVGCMADGQCAPLFCSPLGTCVACTLDVHCAAPTPVCDTASTFTCVECTNNTHCGSGQACNLGTSTCGTDTDGDGLPDVVETTVGTDPNDEDSDDDGVRDGAERSYAVDTDGDGFINALDEDSDNDGLLDGTELGVSTPPAGTNTGRGFFVADGDAGATTTDPLDADSDNGGVRDASEDINRNGVVDPGETNPNDPADDSGVNDTDGDGLSNGLETSLGTDPNDADSDDDGVADGVEPNLASDTDRDGLINALDEDSDNDTLLDGTERGVTTPLAATNVARGHFVADADGTTTTNPLRRDTDGGGRPDGQEDLNRNGLLESGETNPLDPADDNGGGGGGPTDSDLDGLPNVLEQVLGTDPNDADTDDDGVLDGAEPNLTSDTDGDGLINALDEDSDNDGLLDGTELGVVTAPAATQVSRGNFIADADPTTTTSALLADTDRGGVRDASEDINRNGRVDAGERDPRNPVDDLPGSQDQDGDGLSDGLEGTLGTNPNDADSDDDGVTDGAESNLASDTDGDGRINALDDDSDDDGLKDGTEQGITTAPAATNVSAGGFVADADPTTTTRPLLRDTDGGSVSDGVEDANRNGRVDAGERDPNNASDDLTGGGSSSGGSGGSSSQGTGSGSGDASSGGGVSGSEEGSSGGAGMSSGSSVDGSSGGASGGQGSGGSSGAQSSGGSGDSNGSSSEGASSSDLSSGGASSSEPSSSEASSGGSGVSSSSGGSSGGGSGASSNAGSTQSGSSIGADVGGGNGASAVPQNDLNGDGFPDSGVATGGCLGCSNGSPSDSALLALGLALLFRTRRRTLRRS